MVVFADSGWSYAIFIHVKSILSMIADAVERLSQPSSFSMFSSGSDNNANKLFF